MQDMQAHGFPLLAASLPLTYEAPAGAAMASAAAVNISLHDE